MPARRELQKSSRETTIRRNCGPVSAVALEGRVKIKNFAQGLDYHVILGKIQSINKLSKHEGRD